MHMTIKAPAGRRKKPEPVETEWRPAEYLLPSIATLERLSQPDAGQRQAELFPEPPAVARDDSRDGRLARLGGQGGSKPIGGPPTGNRPSRTFFGSGKHRGG